MRSGYLEEYLFALQLMKDLFKPTLHSIITRSDEEIKLKEMRKLLQQGADCEKRDDNGDTPLAKATRNGEQVAALFLLEWGTKVNVVSQDGYRPKEYNVNYTCDHEFDPGACIEGKQKMDTEKRELLTKLAELEENFLLKETGKYDLEQIKEPLKSILVMKDSYLRETLSKPLLKAVFGYIMNNVPDSQRIQAQEFLVENSPEKIDCEKILLRSQQSKPANEMRNSPKM